MPMQRAVGVHAHRLGMRAGDRATTHEAVEVSNEGAAHRHSIPDLDDFLQAANSLLVERFEGSEDDDTEGPPPILVVGPPRSGTTLAIQTIAAATGFGYLSNVAALLWARPALGVRLSRMIHGEVVPTTRQSFYGRTQGATEPHEAGRLWVSALGCNSMVEAESLRVTESDLLRLRSRLRELTREMARPTLLKGFHATFLLPRLQALLPELHVVRLRRNAEDVVKSIVSMRERSDNPKEWRSIHPLLPAELSQADLVVQAAAQVVAIENRLDADLRSMNDRHVADLHLQELVDSPQAAVDRTLQSLELKATTTESPPPNPAVVPASSRRPAVPDADIRDALATARGLLGAE